MKHKKLTVPIFCNTCNAIVVARLTNGQEIYPLKPKGYKKEYYICDACCQFTILNEYSNKPVGNIPAKHQIAIRHDIKRLLDPLRAKHTQHKIRKDMSRVTRFGRYYHTAELKGDKEHERALKAAKKLNEKLLKL